MTLPADADAEGCKDSPLITRFPGREDLVPALSEA